jgi:hypothetical protein
LIDPKKNVKKLQFPYPYASVKDIQGTEKHSVLKREHPALSRILTYAHGPASASEPG